MTRFSPLASLSATREVLDRYGLSLKKSLGQNFLVNDAVVGKIVELSEVGGEDVVLEVGPGIGTLTYTLLEVASAVVSIERDPALPPVLEETLATHSEKFALVGKDALDVDPSDLEAAVRSVGAPFPNKMVANLPYAVAATVVLDYFQRFVSLDGMTVMVQREVAERMMARPGSKNYGAYTVKLSMHAESRGSFSVGPGNFMPPPHVESTVLRLDRREADAAPEVVEAACMMADAAFFARRKTLANSCRQYFAGRDAAAAGELPAVFEAAGVDAKLRGEALSPEEYLALGAAYVERMSGR